MFRVTISNFPIFLLEILLDHVKPDKVIELSAQYKF